jgi:hypothetical protein
MTLDGRLLPKLMRRHGADVVVALKLYVCSVVLNMHMSNETHFPCFSNCEKVLSIRLVV